MNVEYVEFIFENCEVFRLSGEDIGELYLDDINHHYRRITANFVERFEYVNTFFIEIPPLPRFYIEYHAAQRTLPLRLLSFIGNSSRFHYNNRFMALSIKKRNVTKSVTFLKSKGTEKLVFFEWLFL